MAAPEIPITDPSAVIAQALLDLAECYPDDAEIAALVTAGTEARCLQLGDVLGLFALAAAKAACNAKNPDPTCCEADPFVVPSLEVTGDMEVGGNTTIIGLLNVAGDIIVGGKFCAPALEEGNLLVGDWIVAISPEGCLKRIPASDLTPFNLLLSGNLEVDGTAIMHGDVGIGGNTNVDGDLVVGGNIFLGAGICFDDLPESDFTADAQLLFIKGGCLYALGTLGTCCPESPPPDPDPPTPPDPPSPPSCPLRSIPPIPGGLLPLGTDGTHEYPTYPLRLNPAADGEYRLQTATVIGPDAEVDYTDLIPGDVMFLIGPTYDPDPDPTYTGIVYYKPDTDTWSTTAPSNNYLEVWCYTHGVAVFSRYDNTDYPVEDRTVVLPTFFYTLYGGTECPA